MEQEKLKLLNLARINAIFLLTQLLNLMTFLSNIIGLPR